MPEYCFCMLINIYYLYVVIKYAVEYNPAAWCNAYRYRYGIAKSREWHKNIELIWMISFFYEFVHYFMLLILLFAALHLCMIPVYSFSGVCIAFLFMLCMCLHFISVLCVLIFSLYLYLCLLFICIVFVLTLGLCLYCTFSCSNEG